MKKKQSEKTEGYSSETNQYIPAIPLKKIPPEKAYSVLRNAGYDIDEKQSEEIMEFLYIIVKLTLKEYFASD